MNILFICTSNKDRSPALEKYFEEVYPQHNYKSAGINKYFTNKNWTHYLTIEDVDWADLIVYAEDIHYAITVRDFKVEYKPYITLNLGEYKQGQIREDYLMRVEEKLKTYLQ